MAARALRLAVLAVAVLLAGCQSELYTDLPEQEANEMLALLLDGGVTAAKVAGKDGTDALMVDQSQFSAAIGLLRTQGYPRAKFASMNDAFQQGGLVSSPVGEQARYLWALGQELSKTVSQIDGVLTARVQVVLPDNDLMKRQATPSSASVFIRYDEGSQVATLVSQIKMLVANSVQGLGYDRVSVVLVPVPRASPRPAALRAPAADWEVPAGAGAAAAAVLLVAAVASRHRLRRLLDRTRPPAPEPAE